MDKYRGEPRENKRASHHIIKLKLGIRWQKEKITFLGNVLDVPLILRVACVAEGKYRYIRCLPYE